MLMAKRGAFAEQEYTDEELIVLGQLRRSSGRICRNCEWYSDRGTHKGCFPDGKYRKWLSPEEFEAGCDIFLKRVKKG